MKITKLVCLGDSLTEGYGLDTSVRWTQLLEQELNIPIINKGISGDLTGGMLSRFQNDVVATKPSHLILMGGTNDISFNLDDATIIGNIKTMIRQSKYYNIEPIIGIPTPCYPSHPKDENMFIEEDLFIKRMSEFSERLLQFIKIDQQCYIDFRLGMNHSLFMEDGVHPNEEGQKVMVQNAIDIIHNFFESN